MSQTDDVKDYRKRAEICRVKAENASNLKDKERWLNLAQDWEELANATWTTKPK